LHSGDEVKSGVKYTMRSDLMYEYESSDVKGGDIVFGKDPIFYEYLE